MDEGLVNGHATDFLEKQADHNCFTDWLEIPRRKQAFNKFVLSSQMDHEGRVLETMKPLICPPFKGVFIPAPWNPMVKAGAAQLVTTAQEADFFCEVQGNEIDYTERSIFLNNFLYMSTAERTESTVLTVANISHHTIKRMLERNFADPENLDCLVWLAMSTARDLAQVFDLTSLDKHAVYDFMIPFMSGAFFARTMKVSTGIAEAYQGDRWVLSLRTFYDAGMLKSHHHERMAGTTAAAETGLSVKLLK